VLLEVQAVETMMFLLLSMVLVELLQVALDNLLGILDSPPPATLVVERLIQLMDQPGP
jgi:hypothetical protein